MRVPLVLLGGIVVLSVAVARALSCVCSPLECDVLTDDDCPGGLTWDPCQCCKVCARVEGEPCGGLFGFSGRCAVGLQCVIKNLLHHTKEVDEGTCSKIPGRWRRHCPQGLKMSEPGCNLIGEGMTNNPGNVLSAGRCSCGPSVLWCPSEPRPYTYETRHECILNLVAKLNYDQIFNSPDVPSSSNETLEKGKKRLTRSYKSNKIESTDDEGQMKTQLAISSHSAVKHILKNVPLMSTVKEHQKNGEFETQDDLSISPDDIADHHGMPKARKNQAAVHDGINEITTGTVTERYIDKKMDELMASFQTSLTSMKRSLQYDLQAKVLEIKNTILANANNATTLSLNITDAKAGIGVALPIDNLEAFQEFDRSLVDQERKKAVMSLYRVLICGETNSKSCIAKIMPATMTKSVELNYSGTGRKINGKGKLDFSKTTVFNCLQGVHGTKCPADSVLTVEGACKCVSVCPTNKCRPGERPLEVRAATEPVTPGSCCPLYDCVPSEHVSWARTDDGQHRNKCVDDTGTLRESGEEWHQGPCVNCSCEMGSVSCHATMCKSCEKSALLVPGECCPRCLTPRNETTTDTDRCSSLDDCQLPCKPIINEKEECPTCQCPENKVCPSLNDCGPNCMLVKDDDGCQNCDCNENEQPESPPPQNSPDTSEDTGAVCPELKCDLHCERGLIMDENDCTLCQCKPQTGCPSMLGCKKKCPYGYKTNRRGCPVCRCRATCTDLYNTTHPEGTSWEPDACTSCICDSVGRLVCKETVCSVACNNPISAPPGSCCPICPTKHPDRNETTHHTPKGWGTVPIILISTLALLCIMLIFYVIRGQFRGRLSQKTTLYSTYPTQYYKSVPAYEAPIQRNDKIVPL